MENWNRERRGDPTGRGEGERGNWEDVEQGGVEGDDDGELEQGAAWPPDWERGERKLGRRRAGWCGG